jgi:hypothetical protein
MTNEEKVIDVIKNKNPEIETLKGALNDLNVLRESVNTGAEVLVPLLRGYLEAVRSIRMAFDTEVKHILLTSQQISDVSKNVKQFHEYAVAIEMISHALKNPALLHLIVALEHIHHAEKGKENADTK